MAVAPLMGYRGVTQADGGWDRAVGQKQLMTNLKLDTHTQTHTHGCVSSI